MGWANLVGWGEQVLVFKCTAADTLIRMVCDSAILSSCTPQFLDWYCMLEYLRSVCKVYLACRLLPFFIDDFNASRLFRPLQLHSWTSTVFRPTFAPAPAPVPVLILASFVTNPWHTQHCHQFPKPLSLLRNAL
jgi:hypothetical protein